VISAAMATRHSVLTACIVLWMLASPSSQSTGSADEREAPSELFELGEAAEGVNLFGSMGAVPNKLGASLQIAAGKRLSIPDDRPWDPQVDDGRGDAPVVKDRSADAVEKEIQQMAGEIVASARQHLNATKKPTTKKHLPFSVFKKNLKNKMKARYAIIQAATSKKVTQIRESERDNKEHKAAKEAAERGRKQRDRMAKQKAKAPLAPPPPPVDEQKPADEQEPADVTATELKPSAIALDSGGRLKQYKSNKRFQVTKNDTRTDDPKITAPVWGPVKVASFPDVNLEPVVTLAVQGLKHNPEFMEWVNAKPATDVERAGVLRSEALKSYNEAMVQAAEFQTRADNVIGRIKDGAWKLGLVNDATAGAQTVGFADFAKTAADGVSLWGGRLRQLTAEQKPCFDAECQNGVDSALYRFEKLNSMLVDLEADFAKVTSLIDLESNSGARGYASNLAHKMWAGLYEAKDDLVRMLPDLFKAHADVKIAKSAYVNRLEEELRFKQTAQIMNHFPIPEQVSVTAMSNDTEFDVIVGVNEWAQCRCALVVDPRTGVVECPGCDRELWIPSEIYNKWGQFNMKSKYSRRMLRHGALPRQNPIVCDLDRPESKKGTCAYVCKWENPYGTTAFSKKKKKRCAESGKLGKALALCLDTYISIPSVAGKDQSKKDDCAMQVSAEDLWKRLDKRFVDQLGESSGKVAVKTTKSAAGAEKPIPEAPKAPHRASQKSVELLSAFTQTEDKVWGEEDIAQQTPSRYDGWTCIRSIGKGMIHGYECSMLDLKLGFVGFRGALRYHGSTAKTATGECLEFKRTHTETRSVCGCCPRFECQGNCAATYDDFLRKRYDMAKGEACDKENPIPKGSSEADIFLIDLEIHKCNQNFPVAKKTRDMNNVITDLSKPWKAKKPLPIDDLFTDRFGSNWQTKPGDLHNWYCKTMWKYSTVDLASPDKLTAPMIGVCSNEGDGDIHKAKQEANVTHFSHPNMCEKKIVPEFVVKKQPFTVKKVSVTYPSDESEQVRPPGVFWPKQTPDAKIWPVHEPISRQDFCFGCCQQLFPKSVGCPKIARRMEGDKPTEDRIKVPLPKTVGQFEWELPKEPEPDKNATKTAQANIAMISLEESEGNGINPIAEDSVKPGFQWAISAWGVARRRRRAAFVFPRRRRRFYDGPIERAQKVKLDVADKALERAQKAIKLRRSQAKETNVAKFQAMESDERKNKVDLEKYPQEAEDRATSRKLPFAEVDLARRTAKMKVQATTKQRLEATDKKFLKKEAQHRNQVRLATIVAINAKRRIRFTKGTNKRAEAKAYKTDAEWEAKASKATTRLAEKLVKAQDKAENRWEVIGYQKDQLAVYQKKRVIQKLELAKMDFKLKQSAMEAQTIKLKIASGVPVTSDDMSDITKGAVLEVQNSVDRAQQGIAKKLEDSWIKFIQNSKITLKLGKTKVKGDLASIQQKVVEEHISNWAKTDCNAKAKSVYYRTLIQQEIGQTNSRGEFSETPQCTTLESYRAMCDADMVKTCKTQQIEKGAFTGSYRCVKRAKVELSELSKVVYCPRQFDDLPHSPCVSIKTCDESSKEGSMSKDCALF